MSGARRIAVLFALGLALSPAWRAAAPAELERIRADIVEMRFEQALSGLDELLGRTDLAETDREQALVLRAEAHAAFGKFEALDRDYSEILSVQPGFAPDPKATPSKAMQRFEKVRAKTVGKIALALDPADATVLVDGRAAAPDAAGSLWVLAGPHTLRAERAGNDPAEQAVEVPAGGSVDLRLALVPNARTVVLRTVPDGVRVTVDGESVGQTSRDPAASGAPQPAQLVLENLPLGEHVFELSKECYRTERVTDTLAVDLLDRSPKSYQVVRLVEVRTPLELRGGPDGAEVRVDGKTIGRLPAETLEACPGTREISIVQRGRVLWKDQAELREAVPAVHDVAPRPNAVVVGAEAWPPELQAFAARLNTIEVRERPAGADLTTPEGFAALGVPQQQIDLVLAVLPGEPPASAERWFLYSPILRAVAPLAKPPAIDRPRWATTSWGFGTVDSASGGPARVMRVRAGSPAATAGLVPGDSVLEVGGRAVASAAEVRATLEAARTDRPMRIKWRNLAGQQRDAELVGRPSPLLVEGSQEQAVEAIVRAAWAVVDGAAQPAEASSAMANLGLLLAEFGQPDLAAEVWRRVDWGGRDGIGEGTKQYYLGRLLERSGRESEAAAAYRRAAESRATAFSDDGPPIALAARDRLVDLGVDGVQAALSNAPLSAR
jgi:hypothetical protein